MRSSESYPGSKGGGSTAIEVINLSKTFSFGGSQRALSSVNLRIDSGEMVALIGASGSGKSTLLRQMSGLITGDRAPAGKVPAGEVPPGEVLVFGESVQRAGLLSSDVRRIRARIGFVAQQFNLVDRLPLLTNVLIGALHRMPAWRALTRTFPANERQTAFDALAQVGIEERALQRASTLSGGQQQRAAIARALVQQARVILADEPIASLDPESSRRVMELLAEINRGKQVTVVVSLHQVEYAKRYCPRTIALRRGEVVFDGESERLTPDLLRRLYGTESHELIGDPVGAPAAGFAASSPGFAPHFPRLAEGRA